MGVHQRFHPRPDRLLAGVRAIVVPQVGKPSFGLIPHQVGDRGELAAVRDIQLPREPCRLVVAPEFGYELHQDSLFAPRRAFLFFGCNDVAECVHDRLRLFNIDDSTQLPA